VPASGPVVVLSGNRVLACSEAARADGVRRGLRRREAQARCPQLVAVADDPGRDARAFEPVVAAVEEVAVGVEVIRPGACALAARGPAGTSAGRSGGRADRRAGRQACAGGEQVGSRRGVRGGAGRADGRIVAPGDRPVPGGDADRRRWSGPSWSTCSSGLGVKTLGDFARCPAGTC
jgi:protein ImuB